ncbi:CBS domain-containing protein [Acinetobacter bohemicus]|uniref:Magnesium and cobalt efflux protein CorC n=1 Tax=Acinetobacter lwoffii TaxID=28090 RepID=A0A9D2URN9_ACILW|nr:MULTISPECIES: CBS domain-containing protein [Acinetobacter]HJF27666.1 CBS domain-containing protein [Acinetobacter lwoffii]MCO8042393.1 CBS domain-containing protein [Acinetobacter sp. S4400-12]MCU7224762.1 CBS domain-containing protein [Acinetobacter bohemicus]QKQ69006.1 CBS domain-containing protein [Acinetobacter sp. 10FS3-1]TQR62617.1 CBS domain-containing protein [Acinetobacter sp. RF14B]
MHEESGPSWGMRGLRKWLGTAPETRDELLKLVQDSRRFLEPDTVAMLEGVLDLPATKVREVMTPRTSMISLQEDDELLDILHVLVESAHSRFPVFSSDQPDNVVGILLAKDLLPFLTEPSAKVDIRALMRQPLFVPESARSDQLLRMLKNTQTHIAIVIDEYGTTSGLVTLEDILEEIVGEIEDEHDNADEESQYIVPDQDPATANTWIVQALTPIEYFNTMLDTQFSDDEVETMGGLLLQEIGLVSDLEGQVIELDNWQFTILAADSRSIHLIRAVRQ